MMRKGIHDARVIVKGIGIGRLVRIVYITLLCSKKTSAGTD